MADLDTLIARLIRGEVNFVIVGGFAAVAHGATLTTQDLDICCSFKGDDLRKLVAAVTDLHPVHRMTPQRKPLDPSDDSILGWRNLYLDTDLGQLDCLSEIDGIGDFERVMLGSVDVDLPQGRCRVLSLDALIAAKEAMDRPRDRQAVLELKAIRERLAREP